MDHSACNYKYGTTFAAKQVDGAAGSTKAEVIGKLKSPR
jgi:hypothetical protein